MRVLYLDCFSGISGDMTVGALCDLGVPPSVLEWELAKLDGLGDFHMHFERVDRSGISAVQFKIHEGATHTHECDEHTHEHGHSHERSHGDEHSHSEEHSHHGHTHGCCHAHGGHDPLHTHRGEHSSSHAHDHPHSHGHSHASHDESHGHVHGRSFRDIRLMIESSDLSAWVKEKSVATFQRIAEAEGRIHGKPPQDVTFHEVGALDSIADIACVAVAMENLKVDRVICSPLAEGSGFVQCAHGRFPIPAPATLEILKGVPLRIGQEQCEMITPTGAAIAREYATNFEAMPEIVVEKIGYGAGTRNPDGRPNVLRAVLGTVAEVRDDRVSDTVTVIETNIDDLSPEIAGSVMERLMAGKALEASYVPAFMKKNRPGFVLSVICNPADAGEIAQFILSETSSFGVRMHDCRRMKLDREIVQVATVEGEIAVKIGRSGGKVVQVAPEYESCAAASRASGRPLREVYASAIAAWHAIR